MSEDKPSGCDSYKICECGEIVYFSKQPKNEPNLLQRNYESSGITEHQTDEKVLICPKCGNIIPLC